MLNSLFRYAEEGDFPVMQQLGEEEREKIKAAYTTAVESLEALEEELAARMMWSEHIEIRIHKRLVRGVMELWMSRQASIQPGLKSIKTADEK